MSDLPVLDFDLGTLSFAGLSEGQAQDLPVLWDDRTKQYRAEARRYRQLILDCRDKAINLDDRARRFGELAIQTKKPITPRRHQQEALDKWLANRGMGVVQLPTGAGKTYLAILAILKVQRPTLVLVPTIDLVHQWYEVLSQFLPLTIGTVGGGSKDYQDVTVSTYDSAAMFAEFKGNQFGMLIADECHHLPAPQYRLIAEQCIAPFRLGLSATVERADGKEGDIFELMGPLVFDGLIDDLEQSTLAPYDVVNIEVPMTEEERARYDQVRKIYTSFLGRSGIRFDQGQGWQEFVIKSSYMPGGRAAMKAYREQKKLAQASRAKIDELWNILQRHREEPMILFTDDNEMAYRIGRTFFLPVLTHQTKLAERKKMLAGFREGTCKVLVTSKVLNEGVDVPEASVAVVVSGSGTVREHVQRLGRILRHQPGKRATLYELVSEGDKRALHQQKAQAA